LIWIAGNGLDLVRVRNCLVSTEKDENRRERDVVPDRAGFVTPIDRTAIVHVAVVFIAYGPIAGR